MGRIEACIGAKNAPPGGVDARVADIAARQHGVISASQLRVCGLSRRAIVARADAKRLHRVHRGVFAVGHAILGAEGRWMAAVLACGDGAVLSHRSAAALWDIRPTSRGRIDVTVPARCRRTRPGIDIHRPRTLTAEDCDRARAVPCTSVARTLVDLAEVIDRRQLERAVNRAEILNLLDHRALTSALERVDGRTSRKVLESVLADTDRHDTLTRSELEERFLALCRAGGLPQPRVNAWIALDGGEGLEVDFLWTSRRLIAETDGRAVHTTHSAFENDRRRDQRLAAVGYTVLRFTYEQVTHRPDEVQTTLRRLLTLSGPAPTPP